MVSENGGKIITCSVRTRLERRPIWEVDRLAAVRLLKKVTTLLEKSTCGLFASKKSRPKITLCPRCGKTKNSHGIDRPLILTHNSVLPKTSTERPSATKTLMVSSGCNFVKGIFNRATISAESAEVVAPESKSA